VSGVAVVGATGAVGRTIIEILAQRDFPVGLLRLFASSRSAGDKLETAWGEIEVEDLQTADPVGLDLALFSAGAARSRIFAPVFAGAGAVVVDNSSAFRMDPAVPLVVAEVNGQAIAGHSGIVANPNCTTMTLMMAVAPLHRAAGLVSMVVSTYQSVSGSGRTGIDELSRQLEQLGAHREALVEGGWQDPGGDLYARPIAYNVLPLAGTLDQTGYTEEEWKLVKESRKILEIEDLEVEPTCVRVPVMVGHSVSATLRFVEPIGVEEAKRLLDEAPGVSLWDQRVPTPLDSVGSDDVLVGRVRPTMVPGGISLFATGDNLRKGAALNAVQIAERVLSSAY
jgi:aspartate-semialdehyde dehydrogenase